MPFLTHEMSKRHKLHKKDTLAIFSNGKEIEHVKSTKILGVTFNENLKCDDHVNEILKISYYTLHTMRHFKRLMDFHLKKNLAESLILSKINFAITIYGN